MKKKILKKLSDGELEVMQALWTIDGKATRKDIGDALMQEHPMAMTTLLTFLSRLAEKEFVKIEKIGNANVYTPLVNQHDYISSQSNAFIKKLCGGNISAFVSALCDSGISREDLQELRKFLDEEIDRNEKNNHQ